MKLKLLSACVVNRGTKAGGEHFDIGAVVELDNEDTAGSLVRMGRAKFVNKQDDWDKSGANTINDDDQAIIDQQLAAKAESKKVDKAAGKAA